MKIIGSGKVCILSTFLISQQTQSIGGRALVVSWKNVHDAMNIVYLPSIPAAPRNTKF